MLNTHDLYIRTWLEIDCPKCKKTNFYDNGNCEDLTVSDIEGFECVHCNYKFVDESYQEIRDDMDVDDIDYELGIHMIHE